MFGFIKDHFLYINCPRNGYMTFTELLSKNGWQSVNLFDNNLDLNKFIIWAHITDPHKRHTRGVDKFLMNNPDIDVYNDTIGKLLVSAVFDEHTYSLSMMLGSLWNLPINWIPLDCEITKWLPYPEEPEILNGDDLTNIFFDENNIDLQVTQADRRNSVTPDRLKIRQKIEELKTIHVKNYAKLVKNFLEPDLLLYKKVLDNYRQKYLLCSN